MIRSLASPTISRSGAWLAPWRLPHFSSLNRRIDTSGEPPLSGDDLSWLSLCVADEPTDADHDFCSLALMQFDPHSELPIELDRVM